MFGGYTETIVLISKSRVIKYTSTATETIQNTWIFHFFLPSNKEFGKFEKVVSNWIDSDYATLELKEKIDKAKQYTQNILYFNQSNILQAYSFYT